MAEIQPPDRQTSISDAVAKVRGETLKAVEQLERVGDSAGKEAADLHTSLTSFDGTGSAAATASVARHRALPREEQVMVIHELSHLLAGDSGSTAERAAAREYLTALAAADPCTHLLDERSRKMVNRALARSKDPAKYQRARHLALASRAMKESAARVRELIELS